MAICLFCRGELVTAFESNVFAIGTWNLQRRSSVHGGRYLGSCHCGLHNHPGRLPRREQASQCHHVAKPPHRPSSHRGNCVYIRFNVLSRNMAGIYVKGRLLSGYLQMLSVGRHKFLLMVKQTDLKDFVDSRSSVILSETLSIFFE